jgi:hypothetical protein
MLALEIAAGLFLGFLAIRFWQWVVLLITALIGLWLLILIGAFIWAFAADNWKGVKDFLEFAAIIAAFAGFVWFAAPIFDRYFPQPRKDPDQ